MDDMTNSFWYLATELVMKFFVTIINPIDNVSLYLAIEFVKNYSLLGNSYVLVSITKYEE